MQLMSHKTHRMPKEFVNYTKSSIPAILSSYSRLSPSHIQQIAAVAHVFPFRVNNYVLENLINWDDCENDPIFKLTFPQPEMLCAQQRERIINLMKNADDGLNREAIRREAIQIREKLNPHPAKQKEMNVPRINAHTDEPLPGVQHKYRETMLFFPSEAQWCHAYCTYCFRWAQFTEVGSEQQFKSKDTAMLIEYIKNNKQLTDIIFTGGDTGVMKTDVWRKYLEPMIDAKNAKDLEHLTTIRIGTKALSYWPYRFTHNADSDDFLRLLERCIAAGKHVTIQAHFTHYQELQTPQVAEAVRRLRMTGANIRSQAPIMKHVNDDAFVWQEMWRKQASMGIIPYYLFVARDTGPRHYFELPLVRAYDIFTEAVSGVSGIARTVRGPSMSNVAGKIGLIGVVDDMMILKFFQSRNPKWMQKPFLAKLDTNATWIDELKPYDGSESFFYQQELDEMDVAGVTSGQITWN